MTTAEATPTQSGLNKSHAAARDALSRPAPVLNTVRTQRGAPRRAVSRDAMPPPLTGRMDLCAWERDRELAPLRTGRSPHGRAVAWWAATRQAVRVRLRLPHPLAVFPHKRFRPGHTRVCQGCRPFLYIGLRVSTQHMRHIFHEFHVTTVKGRL